MAEFLITEKQRAAFFKKQLAKPSGCVEWIGSKNNHGYGCFWANGKVRKAHRVSYAIAFGEEPKDLCILHRCDNPSCVNPEHLFAGTHTDNMRDMYAKRRKETPKNFISSGKRNKNGNKNPNSLLTWSQVHLIRASSETAKEAGIRFGVTAENVRLIRANKTWKE